VSNNFPGGLIRKTPVTPAGPFQNGAAPGVWTLAEASFWTKQGLWPIAGNLQPVVEDVFSTYLYTGNGATQTINNGINLANNGGLVWAKSRTYGIDPDTSSYPPVAIRVPIGTGAVNNQGFRTDDTSTTANLSNLSAISTTGFTVAASQLYVGGSATFPSDMVSWTFREAPKFFSVVTYTGTGVNRTIAHNLGSVPGCIIVKRTDANANWQVYHRSNANTQYMVLNDTAAVATGATRWNSTTPTASVFSVGTDATVNASGGTYIAYLFAHDAGGFGPTITDNIISCGIYTGNGSATGPVVTLGYEPQWLMVKRATGGTGNWQMLDNMRGLPVGSADATLQANLSNAETSVDYISPTATGFQVVSTNSQVNTNASTYIYIAIRRGPMRTPTLGTSVFAPVVYTGTNVDNRLVNTDILTDMFMGRVRSLTSTPSFVTGDRLRGNPYLATALTAAENTDADSLMTPTVGVGNAFSAMNGVGVGNDATANVNSNTTANNQLAYAFRRAPGFMDEVCYTGTGVVRTVTHNLGVVPELMIVKSRSIVAGWIVQCPALGSATADYLFLNVSNAKNSAANLWQSPTATTFGIGSAGATEPSCNQNNATYVAYLFASAPGVSKVGSYTGNGSSQTINCAFTTGARFVLIKRTDSTGDWYVWDSARGIVAGNDPYLALNSTAAEVTSDDSVDTDNTGFVVNQVAASNINVNAATYIFLAIA
jgi:hypothetical protein